MGSNTAGLQMNTGSQNEGEVEHPALVPGIWTVTEMTAQAQTLPCTDARFTPQARGSEQVLPRVVFGTFEHRYEYDALKVDDPILHRGLCTRTIIVYLSMNRSNSIETVKRDRTKKRARRQKRKHKTDQDRSHSLVTIFQTQPFERPLNK